MLWTELVFATINPATRTLDSFTEALVDAGFIEQEVTERCDLEASFTVTGNAQVSLSAKTEDDSGFCHLASERIADEINNLSTTSTQTDASQVAQLPEMLQFASAAVAAPNLLEERDSNGATALAAFSSYTLLLVAFILAILQ